MKTKLIITLLIAFTITANIAQAQENQAGKNEIRLGYGMLTGPEMVNSVATFWSSIGISILMDTISDISSSFYGVASLEYIRQIKPWLRVGISATMNPINTYIKSKNGFEFTYTFYSMTVMPRVDFTYLNKGPLTLYSGVQLGGAVILWQDKKGSTTEYDAGFAPAFHVNAFGIRIGKEVGAFVEWGYGYRGLVNFGVSGRF
jgi:hypothetical protein